MKIARALLLLLSPVLLAGGDLVRVEETLDAMGATYAVAAYGEDPERLSAAIEASFEETRRLDRLLSNYRPHSEWSQVNRHAARQPYKVSPELFALLRQCQEYSRMSEGAFDITVGPLMKVWGFYREDGRLPGREEISAVLENVGYRHVVLDPERGTVRFDRQGVELDPGGIGKGYAVDRMVAILQEHGVKSAMISAAGSTLYAIGAPPGEAGWKVSIRHPRFAEETVEQVRLRDESMSTSGTYEKFFEAEGKIYSHIMDPRTGYPAAAVLSASVIAPAAIDSEAWTKPVFVNGRAWAARHAPKHFRVFLCEDRAELACAWLQ